jgi:glutathione synthase/RimK-type ligase-like ATP-grasp enzyme
VEASPKQVVTTALRAANLIGDGFYGVDLKETPDGVYVIEVNDNPSIDAGVEDKVLGFELYRQIMGSFRRRFDKQHAL